MSWLPIEAANIDPVKSGDFISNASVPGIVCRAIGGCYDRHTQKTVDHAPLNEPVLLHDTPWQPSGQTKDKFVITSLRQVEKDITRAENWKELQ